MSIKGRHRVRLCGRTVSHDTFIELGFDRLPDRIRCRRTSGYMVAQDVEEAVEKVTDALFAEDFGLACTYAAQASEALWRDRETLAGGGPL